MENLLHNKGELQLRMEHIRKTDPSLAVQGLPEPETWSVQLFRSIDSGQRTAAHKHDCLPPRHATCCLSSLLTRQMPS